jgi:hypothetical protein
METVKVKATKASKTTKQPKAAKDNTAINVGYTLLCLFGETEMQRLTVSIVKETKEEIKVATKRKRVVKKIITSAIDFESPKQENVAITFEEFRQQEQLLEKVTIHENLKVKTPYPNEKGVKIRVGNKVRLKDIFNEETVGLFPEFKYLLVQTKVEQAEKGNRILTTKEILSMLLESQFGYNAKKQILGITFEELGELAYNAFPRLAKILPTKFEKCNYEDLEMAFQIIQKENETNYYFNKPLFEKKAKRMKSFFERFFIMNKKG